MENMLLPVDLNGKTIDLTEKKHILLPFLKVTGSLQQLLAEEEKRNVIVTTVNKELLLLQKQILENRRNFLYNANCKTLADYQRDFGTLPYIVIAIEDLTNLLLEDKEGEVDKALLFLLEKGPGMGVHIAAGASGEVPSHIASHFQAE